MTERFLAAATDGDLDALMQVLAPNGELVVDSGGRVPAPRRSLVGAAEVARFLLAIGRGRQTAEFVAAATATATSHVDVRTAELNGEAGVVISASDTSITAFAPQHRGWAEACHPNDRRPVKLAGVVPSSR